LPKLGGLFIQLDFRKPRMFPARWAEWHLSFGEPDQIFFTRTCGMRE
jgi:hypothetical protein